MLNLLSLATRFEMRSLGRNRVGVVALVAYLSIGLLALFLGERQVAGWEEAILTAQEAQQESIAEATEYLEAGQGPEERPWIDLSEPMWQDYYAGTRVHREPGALAGIASGSVDPAPVAFQVSRRGDPSASGGYRIENPELAMGTVDLIFVLAILSPLLIGVLGLGIGGREREERIDRLIVVQSGEVRGWLLARLVVITGLTALCNACLCLLAGLVGGAGLKDLGSLVGFAVAYAALWGGLLALVNAHARSVRAAALSFGAVWMTICIVLPAGAAEISLARVQADFGVAETLDARSLSYEAYEMADEDASSELYRRYPELAELPAALDEELYPGALRHLTDAVLVTAKADRVASRQQETYQAQKFAEAASWASPALALTLACERLAGVGPEAASGFQGYAMAAVDERVAWVLRKAWMKDPLGKSDFDTLVADGVQPYRWESLGLGAPGAVLLVWSGMAWGLAVLGFRRFDRRMSLPTF